MTNGTPPLDENRRGAVWVTRKLRHAGFEAYVVGGAVRDRILGRPIGDYDIATDATPDQVMSLFKRTVPVGVQFGVVVVLTRQGEYEVATFRAEASYTDGRRPDSIRFVSAREDVLRRDFTINGLLEDPETGEVRDFVRGLEDLKAGVIRAIGAPTERFTEDHLRMLRAVRFAAVLGFDIDAETFGAIMSLSDRITSVSGERIHAELTRMFRDGDPGRGYTLLTLTGILERILPEAVSGGPVASAFCTVGPCPLPAALALLLGPGEPARVKPLASRLKLTSEERARLEYLLREWPRLGSTTTLAASIRFVREPDWPLLATVARAWLTASGEDTTELERLEALLDKTPPEGLRPQRLLDGNDLKAMGLKPGRHFKELLDAVEDAQLEGTVRTRDEALALVTARG